VYLFLKSDAAGAAASSNAVLGSPVLQWSQALTSDVQMGIFSVISLYLLHVKGELITIVPL
jgi:hypothetical protein